MPEPPPEAIVLHVRPNTVTLRVLWTIEHVAPRQAAALQDQVISSIAIALERSEAPQREARECVGRTTSPRLSQSAELVDNAGLIIFLSNTTADQRRLTRSRMMFGVRHDAVASHTHF